MSAPMLSAESRGRGCLEDAVVLRLVAGELDATTQDRAQRHLDTCDRCQDLLALLASGPTLAPVASPPPGLATLPARGADYELGREIARGGMGLVLSARHRWLGRDVAIKVVDGDSTHGASARFAREIRIAARLQHPAIVPVYDAGTIDGAPFYAMRPVEGEPLSARIRSAPDLRARLALLPHVVAAVDAIAYAHGQGVIHRDIKPSNILVGRFGETQVIDWGLAKAYDEEELASGSGPVSADPLLTRDGAVLGTPAYMAPEQARGETADRRSDVFSLGTVLYELLVGAAPGSADSPLNIVMARREGEPIDVARWAGDAPGELVAIAQRALAIDPAERYADASELAADLHRFQEGLLVGAHRYTARQLTRRWLRRHRVLVAALVTGIAVAAIVGGVLLVRLVEERDAAEQQRDTARIERSAAEQVVFHVARDVYDRLDSSGQYDAADALGERLVAYYERVLAVRPGDLVSRGHRAVALDMRANAAFRTGDFQRAEKLWTEITGEMAAVRSVQAEAVLDVGVVFYNLGSIARVRGDSAAAERHFGRAIAELEPVFPLDAGLHGATLAASHEGVAQIRMARLDTPAARRPAERAAEIARISLAADPDDQELQQRAAALELSLASLEALDGRRTDARAAIDRAGALADALRNVVPSEPSTMVGQAYHRIAAALFALSADQLGAVDAHLAQVRELAAAAAETGYADLQLGRLEPMVDAIVAQRELARGRGVPAVAAAARAIAGFAALAQAQPQVPTLRRDEALAHAVYARALALAGRTTAARAQASTAVAALAALPVEPRRELDLARAYIAAAETGATIDGASPDALLVQAAAIIDRLDAAPIAQAPIDHARAWAAAIAARRAPGDRAAAVRYAAARAAIADRMPLAAPTIAELDRTAQRLRRCCAARQSRALRRIAGAKASRP